MLQNDRWIKNAVRKTAYLVILSYLELKDKKNLKAKVKVCNVTKMVYKISDSNGQNGRVLDRELLKT